MTSKLVCWCGADAEYANTPNGATPVTVPVCGEHVADGYARITRVDRADALVIGGSYAHAEQYAAVCRGRMSTVRGNRSVVRVMWELSGDGACVWDEYAPDAPFIPVNAYGEPVTEAHPDADAPNAAGVMARVTGSRAVTVTHETRHTDGSLTTDAVEVYAAPDSVTVRLMGWGTFEEMSGSILALLFGELVRRAIPIVREYASDLFHDAEWLRANVAGPVTFDWMARPSGTNIGAESVAAGLSIGAGAGAVAYRVTVADDGRGLWSATFVTIGRGE